MLPSLFPLSSELVALEVLQEALLGAGAEVEGVEQVGARAGRAGHACREHDVATKPTGRCGAQPFPKDPPAVVPESKAAKPEVPEEVQEEELEEAGRLYIMLATCTLLAFLLFLTVSQWLSLGRSASRSSPSSSVLFLSSDSCFEAFWGGGGLRVWGRVSTPGLHWLGGRGAEGAGSRESSAWRGPGSGQGRGGVPCKPTRGQTRLSAAVLPKCLEVVGWGS